MVVSSTGLCVSAQHVLSRAKTKPRMGGMCTFHQDQLILITIMIQFHSLTLEAWESGQTAMTGCDTTSDVVDMITCIKVQIASVSRFPNTV